MEVFRSVGLQQAVEEAAAAEFLQNGAIMAVESLGGKELAYFFHSYNDGVEGLSPTDRLFVTQVGLEPVLRARAADLGADRSREHLEAHAKGDTVTNCHLRAEQVVEWATRGGAEALGLGDVVGSLEPGKKADVVLIKNDRSPVMFPIVNPYGHVVMQAQRGDVHTVMVDGRIVKHENELVDIDLASVRRTVEDTVEHLRSTLGEEAWNAGMHPEIPESKVLDNPYQYTEYRSSDTHRSRDTAETAG
jgi:hypothetical protein